MTETVSLTIAGIDRLDRMKLEEILAEAGATPEALAETSAEDLGVGKLGSPDLIAVTLQLAPYVISAAAGALALWLTRRKSEKDEDVVHFEVKDGNITYTKFSSAEVAQSSDPEQIKAALNARIQAKGSAGG